MKVSSWGFVAISWCCHAVCPFATSGVMPSCASSCRGLSLSLIVAQNESAAQLLPPPHPTPTLRRPFLAHVHLAPCSSAGRDLRLWCHSTCCLQVEAASSWGRANTPAGRAGPGQDSCGLVPCLHKHTAAAGVSSSWLVVPTHPYPNLWPETTSWCTSTGAARAVSSNSLQKSGVQHECHQCSG